MLKSRVLSLFGPFLLIGLFVAVGVACNETEPELVSDSDDDVAAAPVEPDDDSDAVADDSSAEDADDSDAAPDDSDTEAAADDAELEEAEGFTVGDTVRMGNLVMRLHAVRWDEGGEFMGPDAGMRWLVADIEIENEADSSTTISSLLMFDLVDQDNRTRDLAFLASTEGSLDGELGPGRGMRGDLAWEVREEQEAWELVFSPNVFGFGQAIFDITLADF